MNRLHRSKRSKVILGVCGGLAEYLQIDPTLVRIISVITALAGPGVFIYFIAALVMPEDKGFEQDNSQWSSNTKANYDTYKRAGDNSAYTGNAEETGSTSSFESDFIHQDDSWSRPPKYNTEKNRVVLGAILVGLGVLFLGKQFAPWLFQLKFLVPVLLIGIGGFIVIKGRNR